MSVVSSEHPSDGGVNLSIAENESRQRSFLEQYVKWLDKEPLKARCATAAIVGACGAILGARKTPKSPRHSSTIDWMEVVTFTLHGGLVAGPLSHFLNMFIEQHFVDSRSNAILFDQIVFQPPQIFMMFTFLEISRAAISSIPTAISQAAGSLGASVADCWKFWPLSIYLLSKICKKKRSYVAALNLCSVAWAAHLAKRRSRRT